MSKRNGRPIRFAALIRVSTEKQAKRGESLRTQSKQIKNAVARLGGKITKTYGGQQHEHGTPGWERKQLDEMLADAAKQRKPFDAVMVADLFRWSRDNAKSKKGLQVFRDNGIRFYVLSDKLDLFNKTTRLLLGLTAEFGEFQAGNQSEKSMINRIDRALRGIPTAGKLPFGRFHDRLTNTWSIDEEKKAMMEDVASRYLKGESSEDLADEYGVNHANLHKNLMTRCGTEWSIKFNSDDHDIHEEIPITIPRLLPERTIKALHRKCEANRTVNRGPLKYQYLLAHLVFCSHCGYSMFGQTNVRPNQSQQHRYYRHAHKKRERPCTCKKTWVRADLLEENVMRQVFFTFGNPAVLKRAIEAAVPNMKKMEKLGEDHQRLSASLAKIKLSKDRIVDQIGQDTITAEDAASTMGKLREREDKYIAKLQAIETELENVPTPDGIKAVAKDVTAKFKRFRIDARTRAAMDNYAKMSWEDKRELLKSVLGGTMPDGKRMGVYIEWNQSGSKPTWRYEIKGGLRIRDGLRKPLSDEQLAKSYDLTEEDFFDKTGVTQSASHSRGTALLECRSRQHTPRSWA